MSAIAPIQCPGLVVTGDGLVWVDSLGQAHQLAKAVRLSIGDVATRLNRSNKTVLRRIAAGELYPVIRHSAADIEVYGVAVTDYIHRATLKGYAPVGGAK